MKRLENIDLNLLLLLHWLLEERNVTRAAKRVGLSQPAASRGLQRLREAFSDELLIRYGKGFIPSRLAISIRNDLASAIQHLRSVTHMEDVFDPKTSTDRVVIACNDYLTTLCTQAWIEEIKPQAPLMRSNWRPLDASVKESLVSGQIDLAILPRAAQINIPPSAILQDMVVKPMIKDNFVVFGAMSHPALKARTLSVSEFASYDHVLVSPSGEGLGFVDRVLSDHGHHRHIAHRTASFNHAAELAIISGGLTVIPESLARLRSKGAFRALPFETHPIESDIIWHASRTGDKTHTWLRRQFQSFFKTR